MFYPSLFLFEPFSNTIPNIPDCFDFSHSLRSMMSKLLFQSKFKSFIDFLGLSLLTRITINIIYIKWNQCYIYAMLSLFFPYFRAFNKFHSKYIIWKFISKGCCGCCSALRPRYKRLVDNIFPVNPDDGLVKSNMEKLTFYSLSSPEKLDRIGEYLYQKAAKDIHRKRYKWVLFLIFIIYDTISEIHYLVYLP